MSESSWGFESLLVHDAARSVRQRAGSRRVGAAISGGRYVGNQHGDGGAHGSNQVDGTPLRVADGRHRMPPDRRASPRSPRGRHDQRAHLQRRGVARSVVWLEPRGEHRTDRAQAERLRSGAVAGVMAHARPEPARAASHLPRGARSRVHAPVPVCADAVAERDGPAPALGPAVRWTQPIRSRSVRQGSASPMDQLW